MQMSNRAGLASRRGVELAGGALQPISTVPSSARRRATLLVLSAQAEKMTVAITGR